VVEEIEDTPTKQLCDGIATVENLSGGREDEDNDIGEFSRQQVCPSLSLGKLERLRAFACVHWLYGHWWPAGKAPGCIYSGRTNPESIDLNYAVAPVHTNFRTGYKLGCIAGEEHNGALKGSEKRAHGVKVN